MPIPGFGPKPPPDPEPDPLPEWDMPADDDVGWWRLKELIRAGYDFADAVNVAARLDIDLHYACDLVRKGGATSDQAAQVLL